MLNRGFTVVVVVVEYNIFDFSVVPDVSASGQLNGFFLCSLSQQISLAHKVFKVSVGWISWQGLGGILCTTISLDILLYSLP
jgi:hypothetical protein